MGAVAGLWPFQRDAEPAVTSQVVAAAAIEQPVEFFRPTAGQGALAVVFVLLGLAITTAVARIGGEEPATE